MANFNYDAARRQGFSDEQINEFLKQKEQSGIKLNLLKTEASRKPSFIEKVGDFLGMKEFGQGLGFAAAGTTGKTIKATEVARKSADQLVAEAMKKPIGNPERTRLLKMAQRDYARTGESAQELVSDLPSNRAFIGSAAATGLNYIGARVAPVGRYGADVARFSGLGAAQGIAESIRKEDKTTMQFLQRAGVGALIGAIFPTISAAKRQLGKGVVKTGEKIQQSIIRPNASDYADGFKIENLKKYDLGGTLNDTMVKTSGKLNSLTDDLNKTLTSTEGNPVDIGDVYQQTKNYFTGEKRLSNFGNTASIKRVLGNLSDEITETVGKSGDDVANYYEKGGRNLLDIENADLTLPELKKKLLIAYEDKADDWLLNAIKSDITKQASEAKNLLVNIYDATLIKRGAGTKGAWVFGSADPDASATEKVYTKFYQILRRQIEDNSPEALKEINKQISELIPIQNAVIRRIPVASRNNILGLSDNIGLFASVFDPKALLVIGGRLLSKSGKFANLLTKIGSNVNKLPKSELNNLLRAVGRTAAVRAGVSAD